MKVILGLGNPGAEYTLTRHNAGIMFLDKLASTLPSDYLWRTEKGAVIYKSNQAVLAKTRDKFMNQSGEWVKWLVDYYLNGVNGDDLFIVHDDLDIRLGEYKLQFGTGPKDHGGINSIEASLKTKDFWRVRLGVDNRPAGDREPGEEYVLKRFFNEERGILDEVIEKAVIELRQKI